MDLMNDLDLALLENVPGVADHDNSELLDSVIIVDNEEVPEGASETHAICISDDEFEECYDSVQKAGESSQAENVALEFERNTLPVEFSVSEEQQQSVDDNEAERPKTIVNEKEIQSERPADHTESVLAPIESQHPSSDCLIHDLQVNVSDSSRQESSREDLGLSLISSDDSGESLKNVVVDMIDKDTVNEDMEILKGSNFDNPIMVTCDESLLVNEEDTLGRSCVRLISVDTSLQDPAAYATCIVLYVMIYSIMFFCACIENCVSGHVASVSEPCSVEDCNEASGSDVAREEPAISEEKSEPKEVGEQEKTDRADSGTGNSSAAIALNCGLEEEELNKMDIFCTEEKDGKDTECQLLCSVVGDIGEVQSASESVALEIGKWSRTFTETVVVKDENTGDAQRKPVSFQFRSLGTKKPEPSGENKAAERNVDFVNQSTHNTHDTVEEKLSGSWNETRPGVDTDMERKAETDDKSSCDARATVERKNLSGMSNGTLPDGDMDGERKDCADDRSVFHKPDTSVGEKQSGLPNGTLPKNMDVGKKADHAILSMQDTVERENLSGLSFVLPKEEDTDVENQACVGDTVCNTRDAVKGLSSDTLPDDSKTGLVKGQESVTDCDPGTVEDSRNVCSESDELTEVTGDSDAKISVGLNPCNRDKEDVIMSCDGVSGDGYCVPAGGEKCIRIETDATLVNTVVVDDGIENRHHDLSLGGVSADSGRVSDAQSSGEEQLQQPVECLKDSGSEKCSPNERSSITSFTLPSEARKRDAKLYDWSQKTWKNLELIAGRNPTSCHSLTLESGSVIENLRVSVIERKCFVEENCCRRFKLLSDRFASFCSENSDSDFSSSDESDSEERRNSIGNLLNSESLWDGEPPVDDHVTNNHSSDDDAADYDNLETIEKQDAVSSVTEPTGESSCNPQLANTVHSETFVTPARRHSEKENTVEKSPVVSLTGLKMTIRLSSTNESTTETEAFNDQDDGPNDRKRQRKEKKRKKRKKKSSASASEMETPERTEVKRKKKKREEHVKEKVEHVKDKLKPGKKKHSMKETLGPVKEKMEKDKMEPVQEQIKSKENKEPVSKNIEPMKKVEPVKEKKAPLKEKMEPMKEKMEDAIASKRDKSAKGDNVKKRSKDGPVNLVSPLKKPKLTSRQPVPSPQKSTGKRHNIKQMKGIEVRKPTDLLGSILSSTDQLFGGVNPNRQKEEERDSRQSAAERSSSIPPPLIPSMCQGYSQKPCIPHRPPERVPAKEPVPLCPFPFDPYMLAALGVAVPPPPPPPPPPADPSAFENTSNATGLVEEAVHIDCDSMHSTDVHEIVPMDLDSSDLVETMEEGGGDTKKEGGVLEVPEVHSDESQHLAVMIDKIQSLANEGLDVSDTDRQALQRVLSLVNKKLGPREMERIIQNKNPVAFNSVPVASEKEADPGETSSTPKDCDKASNEMTSTSVKVPTEKSVLTKVSREKAPAEKAKKTDKTASHSGSERRNVNVLKTSGPKPKTDKAFHGRTLLWGQGVPARVIPLEPLHLTKPFTSFGERQPVPKDPRLSTRMKKQKEWEKMTVFEKIEAEEKSELEVLKYDDSNEFPNSQNSPTLTSSKKHIKEKQRKEAKKRKDQASGKDSASGTPVSVSEDSNDQSKALPESVVSKGDDTKTKKYAKPLLQQHGKEKIDSSNVRGPTGSSSSCSRSSFMDKTIAVKQPSRNTDRKEDVIEYDDSNEGIMIESNLPDFLTSMLAGSPIILSSDETRSVSPDKGKSCSETWKTNSAHSKEKKKRTSSSDPVQLPVASTSGVLKSEEKECSYSPPYTETSLDERLVRDADAVKGLLKNTQRPGLLEKLAVFRKDREEHKDRGPIESERIVTKVVKDLPKQYEHQSSRSNRSHASWHGKKRRTHRTQSWDERAWNDDNSDQEDASTLVVDESSSRDTNDTMTFGFQPDRRKHPRPRGPRASVWDRLGDMVEGAERASGVRSSSSSRDSSDLVVTKEVRYNRGPERRDAYDSYRRKDFDEDLREYRSHSSRSNDCDFGHAEEAVDYSWRYRRRRRK